MSRTRVFARAREITANPSAYLVSLTLTVVISSYANYVKDRIAPLGYSLWGQSPGIYLPFLLFPISLGLWLLCKSDSRRGVWVLAFLGGLGFSWLIHMILIRIHGDLYPHTVWLMPLILLMLAIKTPDAQAAWLALRVLAWSALVITALTFLLERFGLLAPFYTGPESLRDFETSNYFLPLVDLLGLDGRWHGPFGHATKTAFMSAVIVVIAIADRGIHRWILLSGGVLGLVLTGGRAGYLAAGAGLLVYLIFTRSRPLGRIPVTLRASIAIIFVISIGSILYSLGSLGLTGRLPLWEGYLDLWRDSLWIGIGQSGIAASPDLTSWMEASWMDAHNIYINELARFGVIGFVSIFGTLSLGALIMVRSAVRGFSLPLALVTAWAVAATTDVLNDRWSSFSVPLFLLVLAVLASALQPRAKSKLVREGTVDDASHQTSSQ